MMIIRFCYLKTLTLLPDSGNFSSMQVLQAANPYRCEAVATPNLGWPHRTLYSATVALETALADVAMEGVIGNFTADQTWLSLHCRKLLAQPVYSKIMLKSRVV